MKYFINRSYNKRAKKWRTQSPVSKTVKSTLNKMILHEAISKLHQNSIWRGKKIIEYTINIWKIIVWTAPIHLHLGFFFFFFLSKYCSTTWSKVGSIDRTLDRGESEKTDYKAYRLWTAGQVGVSDGIPTHPFHIVKELTV